MIKGRFGTEVTETPTLVEIERMLAFMSVVRDSYLVFLCEASRSPSDGTPLRIIKRTVFEIVVQRGCVRAFTLGFIRVGWSGLAFG